jgi:hypothetical protein
VWVGEGETGGKGGGGVVSLFLGGEGSGRGRRLGGRRFGGA